MGLDKFIRARKQVKADRAESGSHQKLVAALNGPLKPGVARRPRVEGLRPGAGHVRSTAEPSVEINERIFANKKYFDEQSWGSQGISKKKEDK